MKVRIAIAVAAALMLFAAAMTVPHWLQGARPAENSAPEDEAEQSTSGTVTLNEQKLASLELKVEPAGRHPLQVVHVVPGRLRYDETRHVDIRAAANGILTQVRVTPGDHVSKEQVLGVVSSPEVGAARTEVHHGHENWELAVKKRDWERETSANVAALIDGLKSRVPPADLEKRFHGKTLGKSRALLFSAYARFLLADELWVRSEKDGQGVLPVATLAERKAERRSAEAALQGACEQSSFDAAQQLRVAEIEAGDALRRLNIAREQVTALLGYSPDNVPMEASDGDVLSRVEIRAPFAGTIEERNLAQAERVKTSDTIFVLADTRVLWVAADVREQDWRALALSPGQEVSVEVPAIPGRKFEARIRYQGRQVTAETNSVPLVAELANPDGLLRPGLFVRVSVPFGTPKPVLSLPSDAVVSHEKTKFVFVRTGPTTFRRTDVTTGLQTDERVEIVSGIETGAPVVVRGAAILKAELLLPIIKKED
ncbi:MAG TPA: efflux RND transporter periplasmic adaptor subunit [Planctomycetaceae bacterium]|nr:efflux RND transporter periplasmic adaptor subunit [Planctomycetaceae bacterium]